MKYIGIVSECEIKGLYKNRDRFAVYYHHSRMFKGKEVRYFEVVEDTSMKPVVVNRTNMKQFHKFFTQS